MQNGFSADICQISPTHQKWLFDYLQNIERQEKSPLTIQSYRSDLLHFLIWFELSYRIHIHRARADHISAYQQFLKTGGKVRAARNFWAQFWRPFLSLFCWHAYQKVVTPKILEISLKTALAPNSRKRRLTALKKFFDYLGDIHRARGLKLFKDHPISSSLHAIKLKDADIEHTKLLKRTDFTQLIARLIYPEDRLLAHLLFDGGLRIREATRLKFTDFDEQKGVLTLIRKGGKRHALRLQNATRIFQELERVKTRRVAQSEFVFANTSGQRPVNVRTLHARVKKYLSGALLPQELSPHSFRKGCATELYQKTRDLLHVRDYLNHQNALVTQTYIEHHSSSHSAAPRAP